MKIRTLFAALLMAVLTVACSQGASEPPTDAPTEAALADQPTQAPTEAPVEEPTEDPSDDMTGDGVTLPALDPAEYSGDIQVAGSSTVFPLSEAMAERFQDEGFGGNVSVASIGSGAGFERFCVSAETDVSNASRPIRQEEVQSCLENGRDPIEFRVGTDALAVTVSSENDFVESVTMEELAQIFSTAELWSDVRPEWPAEEIQRFIPGTDSGTFDYFVEEVFDEDEAPILAPEPQMSEDDNVLVTGILGSPYAIGFFGYAYYTENEDTLNVLDINGVEPSAATVENGQYPLARPLFMYSDATIMNDKPQVAAFLNFVLTLVNEEVEAVGYFPASQAAMDNARQAWLDAVDGM